MSKVHLFYIHSHITFLVSEGVVADIKPWDGEIVYLMARNYNVAFPPDSRVKILNVPESIERATRWPSSGLCLWEAIKTRRAISVIDVWLENHISRSSPFYLYLPHTKNFLMQVLASHPKVNCLNFIEEGMLTYTGNMLKGRFLGDSNMKDIIRHFFCYGKHWGRSYTYCSIRRLCLGKVFVLTNEVANCLQEFPIKIQQVEMPISTVSSIQGMNFENLFIMDNIVENGICSLQTFKEVLDYFADYFKKQNGAKKLWIRFHPAQTIKDEVIEFFRQKGFQVEVMPQTIPLELWLKHNKSSITLYGFYSSLLFYGAFFGHSAYSFLPLIETKSDTTKRFKQHIPSIFFKYVKMISYF